MNGELTFKSPEEQTKKWRLFGDQCKIKSISDAGK